MARADIIVNLSSVAGGGNLDYQPAAGVEVCITEFGGANHATCYIALYDGANESLVKNGTDHQKIALGINNTYRLRCHNGEAGPEILGYSGVQTK